MVGQACEKAAISLVQSRTGVDPTGARWNTTILARANVLVKLISDYFRAAFEHLQETKDSGDLATVFSYLTHPGRKLRIAALQLLVADARRITGPSRQITAKPREMTCWRLVVVGAKGLPRADGPFAKSDPYTVVRWNQQLIGQTDIKIQNLDPIWDEDFLLRMPLDQDSGDVQLQVYDYDRLSDHDLMASLHLKVGDSEIPQRRELRVRIVEARDLPKMDLLGATDPYVSVTVDGGEKQRTKTIDNGGATPEWNELLEWGLMVTGLPSIEITCFDEDKDADDAIGSVMLDLTDKTVAGMWELDEWLPLQGGAYKGGEVRVIATWDPEPDEDPLAEEFGDGPEYKLSVTVVQCEGLPKSDTFGQNDVYVGLVASRQTRKTKTIDGGGTNPVWEDGEGEKLNWSLGGAPDHLDVTVWDDDVGEDDLIGQCQIPLKQHLADSGWKQNAWFHLEDIKGRSAGRVKLHMEWSVIHKSKDASVSYSLNRELWDEKKRRAGTIEVRIEKLAEKVPEPPPVDVVAEAEHRKAVEDGNDVVDDDYIAAVDLVALLCRLKSFSPVSSRPTSRPAPEQLQEAEEKQELVLQLLEAVRMRCLTDHSSMPIAHARLVDTVANGAHSLMMIAVEPIKVRIFERFWTDEVHGYKWMIEGVTNPEDARGCLTSSCEYLCEESPQQMDMVAAWAATEHRAAIAQDEEPDRCILDILLYVALTPRGRIALLKVVDLRLLMRLLQLVENPDLDDEKVDAIRLWAVAGIPVMLVTKSEQEALVEHSGIDLLLPLINFAKRNNFDTSKHVCKILWEIADILETAQFDHIVFTMCVYEQCRQLLDCSELRPFIRILKIDPSGVRDPAIAEWSLDCVTTLMQREGGASPEHLALMGDTGYRVLEKTAETAREEGACTAIAALASFIHQQRHIDELSTLLWFVEATQIDHVHNILPLLDATVVEMFVRQMWEPQSVLDKEPSRHHLYIASCAIVRYICRPPTHPTRQRQATAGRTGWGAEHGEKGLVAWAESLPYYSPLLSFCFCGAAIAPLAVVLPLPYVVAMGPKREEQSVITLLICHLGLCVLSLATFILWATRDKSFMAATRFSPPDWRTENFWGFGTDQMFNWFKRRWLNIRSVWRKCGEKCAGNAKAVGPAGWGQALFAEDVADRYRVEDDGDPSDPRNIHTPGDAGDPAAKPAGRLGGLLGGLRQSASRNLSRQALQSRASSVQMGFKRASKTAEGKFSKCAKKLQTPRGKEAMYLVIDFAQFNGFCFLNHPCWRSAGFFGQILARTAALSHLQLSGDLSASGSKFGWTLALCLVLLYVVGSKCLLVTINVKIQKIRHRWCSKHPKIMPDIAPPTHALDPAKDPELIEFATRANIPLDPTPESFESDCRRITRNVRAVMLYLISNRFLLVFIGSAGFVPVASHLMAAGSCIYPLEYGRNFGPPKIARPPIAPELVCWEDTHRYLLWGSLSALGVFVPLVLLIEPLLAVAERGMQEVHALELDPNGKKRSLPLVVQWAPGYNACRAMGKLMLVVVAAWLPAEPKVLDMCVIIVCGFLVLTCVFTSPCAVHGILKLHVVVLASAITTAGISLWQELYITTDNGLTVSEGGVVLAADSDAWIDGSMDELCHTTAGFWFLMLSWSVLAGLTTFYRMWWGVASYLWGRVQAIRAEEALNKKVLAMAL